MGGEVSRNLLSVAEFVNGDVRIQMWAVKLQRPHTGPRSLSPGLLCGDRQEVRQRRSQWGRQ